MQLACRGIERVEFLVEHLYDSIATVAEARFLAEGASHSSDIHVLADNILRREDELIHGKTAENDDPIVRRLCKGANRGSAHERRVLDFKRLPGLA